jgi:uncharacterized RDD family membrane protein YckC
MSPMSKSPVLPSRVTRFLGQFLDSLIGMAPVIGAILVMIVNEKLGTMLLIGAAIFAGLYYFLADGLQNGQSWAKRLLGMAVVDARTGAPCSMGQSFVRNFLLAILGPFDWIFIFGGEKRRLGDIAAGTQVVAARG